MYVTLCFCFDKYINDSSFKYNAKEKIDFQTAFYIHYFETTNFVKATIPDFVPVILTWMYIIIRVSIYSYKTKEAVLIIKKIYL